MRIVIVEARITDEDDNEIDVNVECEYSELIPAQMCGNPEDCSPEEGGFESIVRVVNRETGTLIPENLWKGQLDEEDIARQCNDLAPEQEEDDLQSDDSFVDDDYYEDDHDDQYDNYDFG
jgi:hypothetical protein